MKTNSYICRVLIIFDMETDIISVNVEAQVPVQSVNRQTLIDQFISSKDKAETTLNQYRRTLNLFFEWVDRSGYELNTLTRQQVIEYKHYLMNEGKSVLTITGYLTSVQVFFKWLEAERIYPNIASVLELPKRTKAFRHQPLRPEQVRDLLTTEQDGGNLRDYAIVNLLVRTGLRTIEVIRANVEDITFRGGLRVLNIQGKGRDAKDNFVILNDKAYQPIAEYLKQRGIYRPSDPLFVSNAHRNTGERMTTRSISRIAKTGLKDIGLNDHVYTAHSLRHTTACSILRAGGTLEDCQMTLRHASPSTTQIYTAFVDEERRLQRNAESLVDSLY